MAKLIPQRIDVTKCHILLAALFLALILTGCRRGGEPKTATVSSVKGDAERFQEWLSEKEHYLHDVNSPYRDEEAYIPVLEEIIASPYADSAQKATAAHELPLFSLNRIGETAADFNFTLRNGRSSSLYKVKADHILLCFSNPGCGACKEMEGMLGDSPFREMVEQGALKVVNIYPDDDLTEWMEESAGYPVQWTSGFAPEVDEPGDGGLPLYNIRAIPTFYLLDGKHRTLLKDAPLERIAAYLLQES